MNLQQLLHDYMEAKDRLTHYKDKEKTLRLSVIDAFFPNANEGTANAAYEQVTIKGTFKMNYKLTKEFDMDELSTEEQECVALKPSLKLADYKALAESEREMLDQFVVVTPALPSLKVDFAEE